MRMVGLLGFANGVTNYKREKGVGGETSDMRHF